MTKHNRTIQKGIDHKKLARIFLVLKESNDWLYVAELARMAQLNQVTVRWYLDHYFKNVIDESKLHPKLRIRMIKLKLDVSFKDLIMSLELARRIRNKD
ncbi:MAG: hypothetical protein KJ697_03865 [Nanoarchaeota archaeon]|nr:hypothetical protein [Nanoarchaeota archaeon]